MAEIRKEVVMLQETIEDMKKKGIDQQARTKSAVGWIRIEGAKRAYRDRRRNNWRNN